MNAEQKVKSVYPEAVWDWGWVDLPTRKDAWRNNKLVSFQPAIWVGERPIVFGGKYESCLWRRAWKAIEKEMLKKLEA